LTLVAGFFIVIGFLDVRAGEDAAQSLLEPISGSKPEMLIVVPPDEQLKMTSADEEEESEKERENGDEGAETSAPGKCSRWRRFFNLRGDNWRELGKPGVFQGRDFKSYQKPGEQVQLRMPISKKNKNLSVKAVRVDRQGKEEAVAEETLENIIAEEAQAARERKRQEEDERVKEVEKVDRQRKEEAMAAETLENRAAEETRARKEKAAMRNRALEIQLQEATTNFIVNYRSRLNRLKSEIEKKAEKHWLQNVKAVD